MTTLNWTAAEWGDGAIAAYVRGLEVSVDADGFWSVRATSAVSEYPELWDAGRAPSVAIGKVRAAASADRAIKTGYCTKETA